jgi:hypothetical protein
MKNNTVLVNPTTKTIPKPSEPLQGPPPTPTTENTKSLGKLQKKIPTLKGLEPSTSVLGGPRATIAPKGLSSIEDSLFNYIKLTQNFEGLGGITVARGIWGDASGLFSEFVALVPHLAAAGKKSYYRRFLGSRDFLGGGRIVWSILLYWVAC